MRIPGTKIDLKKGTTQKDKGDIQADGTIANSDSHMVDLQAFLQHLYQKTNKNIPTTHIIWEEGNSKHHVYVYGTDYNTPEKDCAFIQATGRIIQEQNEARLQTIAKGMLDNCAAYSYHTATSQIDEALTVTGTIKNVIDEVKEHIPEL